MRALDTFIGFLAATIVLTGGLFYMWMSSYYSPLRACARINNVYECSFVAVPKGKMPPMDVGLLGGDD